MKEGDFLEETEKNKALNAPQKMNIGFAVTGSFCTLSKILEPIKDLVRRGNDVVPVFSYSVAKTDTRFYNSDDFKQIIYEAIRRKSGTYHRCSTRYR